MAIARELYDECLQVLPRVCADIVLMNDGAVLLLKRAIEPCKGLWALPGGRIEKGETPLETAIRKLNEEVGVRIKPDELSLAPIATTFFHEIRQDVCFTFVADVKRQPDIKSDYQHDAYQWFPIAQLNEVAMPIQVRHQISEALKGRGAQLEWSNKNKYNSFNSYKGLTYYEHYLKIAGWLKGQNDLPPPIEASLDPINACNHACYYCNSQRYLREQPTGFKRWGRDFLEDTLIYLANWGVKGFCWGGGGEATLNIRLPGMTKFGVDLGMEASIITNLARVDDILLEELLLCRWIGVSLDSADPKVYQAVRGRNDCAQVLRNIAKLVAKRTKTDIAIKALVLPETIDTLAYTCSVAKELGVQDFHVRPVDLERKDFNCLTGVNMDMDNIADVFAECHSMETPDFHVYTVTHKYDGQFHVKHDFSQCLASPLVTQICTDKKMYVCVDHRLEPRFEIQEWGSKEHRQLLLGINPETECARCTWSEYNRQIADCVLEDKLCRNFP